MTRIVFRPIDQWPGQLTPNRDRRTSPFHAGWVATTVLLLAEVEKLGNAHEVIVQVAADETAMRLDGGLRASAVVDHPGAIVSFESKHGPLRYSTDVFTTYQANVRAIALGLEALRRVDRYGIGRRGEQYTGWKALGAGIAVGPAPMSYGDALSVLGVHVTGSGDGLDGESIERVKRAYRRKIQEHHPDHGGDDAIMRRLTEARAVLIGTT